MAITRTAMVDDDGTLTTGTIINNAWKTQLYDQIDALFTTSGTFSFSASSSGGNIVKATNTNNGAASFAAFRLGNDAATIGQLALRSSSFTTAGGLRADGVDLFNDGSGGINVIASHASGRIRFYTAGTADANLRVYIDSAGQLFLVGGVLLNTSAALTNGAAAAAGTLGNAPTAGNPTKWVPINDNGTTRYIPAW